MTYDAAGGSVDPVELIDLVCQDVGYGMLENTVQILDWAAY